MDTFWLCFVPLFVAVDIFGLLPIFIGMTHSLEPHHKKRLVFQSVLTALVVALAFLFVGEGILRLLGITVADFMVAGGLILFVLSIQDIFSEGKPLREIDPKQLGPVPIGVPLIVGPAVLTTIMLLAREYGFYMTALALCANIFITGIAFVSSGTLLRLMGDSGTKITSKIATLFLAAIAVMMIRKGVFALILEAKI